ncbi:MAG: hypothetical protein ABR529_14350 [Actinomycetota bacterium]
MSVDVARAVADAVLYEGYVLYPYRASARKNQVRWQFGVLMPRAYGEAGSEETWFSQTECLVEPEDEPVLHVKLRFLQLQARIVEKAEGDGFTPVGSLKVGEREFVRWDEATEQETDVTVALGELTAGERVAAVEAPEGTEIETIEEDSGELVGRIVRRRWPVSGALRISVRRVEGPWPTVVIRIRVENLTVSDDPSIGRDEALKRSLLAAHSLLALSGGRFVSLLEPPQWARAAAESCSNLHTFPVLVGDERSRDVMLSSPIILYDFPQTAPESPGDLYDATEIDEILTLRTMALTDDEKREARLTDLRAAAIIDRTEAMPPEIFERLHGAIRYVGGPAAEPAGAPAEVPWWDPGADASVSPDTDGVRIGETIVAKGSRVRLNPGSRRADAQDIFLAGRIARVEAVFLDVDDNNHLAVTLEDDPAADLHRSHGRFLYFNPDELEPLDGDA